MFAQGFQSCLVKMKMASEAPFCFLDFLKVGKLEKGGILRLLSARQFEREREKGKKWGPKGNPYVRKNDVKSDTYRYSKK